MADATSFDQWRKDVFFNAAEEVQESADALESVYRMWIRCRSDGVDPEISDELVRELRIALGTAKWQLEEFDRAVSSIHDSYSLEDNTISRHRDFVAALGNQISHIEKALSDSLVEEGKQPLCWVQLNEEERDDLAIFLSVAPQARKESNDRYADRDIGAPVKNMPASAGGFKETVTINKDSRYVIEVAAKEPWRNNIEAAAHEQLDQQKLKLDSSDIDAWKIVIADEQEADRKMVEVNSKAPTGACGVRGFLANIESTAKSKFLGNSISVPKTKSEDHLPVKQECLELNRITRFAQQGVNGLNARSRNCFSSNEDSNVSNIHHNIVGRASGLRRHFEGSKYYMQFGRSLRFTVFLLLAIILLVPFVVYST